MNKQGLIGYVLCALQLQAAVSAPTYISNATGISTENMAARSGQGQDRLGDLAPGDQNFVLFEEPQDLGSDDTDDPSRMYQAFVNKGKQLYDWMSETDVNALTTKMRTVNPPKVKSGESSQSKWRVPMDLTLNGWIKNRRTESFNIDDQNLQNAIPVDTILTSLDINPAMKAVNNQGGANVAARWVQEADRFNGRKEAKATNAQVLGVYNPKDGFIVIESADAPRTGLKDLLKQRFPFSPAFAIEHELAKRLPKLHHVSDVVSIEYLEQAQRGGYDPKLLKYFMWHHCGNPSTNELVDHILEARDYPSALSPGNGDLEAPEWDERLILEPSTDDFYAVLGTPIGAASAWTLFQHKRQFGAGKRVTRISISLDSRQQSGSNAPYMGPTLLFELEDLTGTERKLAAIENPGDGRAGLSKKPSSGSGGAGKRAGTEAGTGKAKGKGKAMSSGDSKGKGKGKASSKL